MKPCRICKQVPNPIPPRWNKWDYRCNKCAYEINKKNGWLPSMSKAERTAYNKKYYANDEVKKKVAVREKRYRKNPKYLIQARCRVAVCTALKQGRLNKKPCLCGDKKVEAHHPDYNKPLNVLWVCKKCHVNIHRKKRDQNLVKN